VAVAVVKGALLGVGQDLVGLRRLLELRLRLLVGVAVGVQLEGELAVGALESGRVGIARNAQDLVVVASVAHSFDQLA
jgi:hypothetical protein